MLKGQAKKDYQREYMRRRRAKGLTSLVRPDDTCSLCSRFGVVDRHHLDKNHNNNGDSNLAKLCPNCHADVHRRGKPIVLDPIQPKETKTWLDADGNPVYEE